jgi:hypothetical protein
MRTNDLRTFMLESEALNKSKKLVGSFVKSYIGPNNTTFWVICKMGQSGHILFLRDNGNFER